MSETELYKQISKLATEQKNPRTELIDTLSTREILELINSEDIIVANAVGSEISYITEAVDRITEAFRQGGRLFYIGAGTSGRLGIVDASECPPTFGSDPEMVQGIIAGGAGAVFKAVEGAEDNPDNGARIIHIYSITSKDIVCGIAASGRTPFVQGALKEARKLGIYTILITTSPREKLFELNVECDLAICPAVGAEVIAGSTRMKSGTAQKLVLNMLTTASMIRLGKTLGNVMVDLQLTNDKLKVRAKRILIELTGISYDESVKYLEESNGHVKTALVMILAGVDANKAHELLDKNRGFVRQAILNYKL